MSEAPRSRTRSAARNAGVAAVVQLLIMLVGFVSRTIFIDTLGVELLGVQTLLLSLMAMVSVADAGVSWALMYALYKPLESRDEARIAAVLHYAKRLYWLVAVGVLALGLAVLPFLDSMVTAEERVPHLTLVYLLLLSGVAFAYPAYRGVLLLEADQRSSWVRWAALAVNVARSAGQIAVLLIWPDARGFVAFLALQAATTLVVNLACYLRALRTYPYLGMKPPMPGDLRREIRVSVRAMLLYRASGLVLNNMTPVLVSVLLGTAVLGYYSNYMLLIGSALMMLEVAFLALTPSVGNLVASGDRAATRRVFDEIHVLAMLLYGLSAVVLGALLEDVLRVWLGPEFVLSRGVLVAAVCSFYLVGAITPVTNFRASTGMFKDAKYVLAATALINVALAPLFAAYMGLPGVLWAAVVARLVTHVWIEPWLLFRRGYVDGGAAGYWLRHALGAGAVAFGWWAASAINRHAGWEGAPGLVLGALVAAVVGSLCLLLVFARTPALRALGSRFLGIVRQG